MFISHIRAKNLKPHADCIRSFSFEMNFRHPVSIIHGANGSGKSTFFRFLAMLVGTDEAHEKIVRQMTVEEFAIRVEDDERLTSASMIGRGIERYAIDEFRAKLPRRATYDDGHGQQFVSEYRPPEQNSRGIHKAMRLFKNMPHIEYKRGKSMCVAGPSSSQVRLIGVGLLRAPKDIPMLLDDVDTGYGENVAKHFNTLIGDIPGQQVIMSCRNFDTMSAYVTTTLQRNEMLFSSNEW
jgi:ABC-type branched-subunit amino acid transport system ATPase component